MMKDYYKITQPNGWDFYTGRTINYRDALKHGRLAKHPHPNPLAGLCSSGVIHASKRAEDCFQGGKCPCALFVVQGDPVCADETKAGFIELTVIQELDPQTVFKWRYAEACSPVDPLLLPPPVIDANILALLQIWASIYASVGASIGMSILASPVASVGTSIWGSIADGSWDSMGARILASSVASIRTSIWGSINASIWAYTGYLLAPAIPEWQEAYPFQSAVDLWKQGLVPSYDGQVWRLHGGRSAKILYTGGGSVPDA